MACCYRTVSYAAAAVVSRTLPIRLLIKERSFRFGGMSKNKARDTILKLWQEDWDKDGVERWTHRLIPDVWRWYSRGFGEITFHLTQFLTGHGCYASYLKRFALQESNECAQCGYSPDTPEHAVLECDAWEYWRRDTCAELGRVRISPIIRRGQHH